jgi:hypothetical protein
VTGGFHRRRRGGVVVTLSTFEGDLLRSLASQLVELLSDERGGTSGAQDPLEQLLDVSGPTNPPDDPVLARLFPTAYPQDEEAAGEFRRFTEGTLRDGKVQSALGVIDGLEQAGLPEQPEPRPLGEPVLLEVELDHAAAMAWLKSLTDMRLALATRLGVEDGDDDYWFSLPEDDPRAQVHEIYQWLGFLQETLVEAVSRSR